MLGERFADFWIVAQLLKRNHGWMFFNCHLESLLKNSPHTIRCADQESEVTLGLRVVSPLKVKWTVESAG